MKKLFCVVVTDAAQVVGLDSPVIFHVKCERYEQAETLVKELLEEEYGYAPETIEELEIFTFEVTELDILELGGPETSNPTKDEE